MRTPTYKRKILTTEWASALVSGTGWIAHTTLARSPAYHWFTKNWLTMVTHEVLVPPTSQKIKIPNICRQFNVPYISSFDLLDALNAKLILGTHS